MKSKPLHNEDEFLDRQISALRTVDVPQYGPGKAIQAMHVEPPSKKIPRFVPLGFCSAAVLSAIVIAAITIPAETANARDLKMVASAEQAQRIWHHVEYFNNLKGPLKFRNESWNSGDKQCLKLYNEEGQLNGVVGYNGKYSYQWYAPVGGATSSVMNIDDVTPEASSLVTVTGLQAEPVLRNVTKSTGVTVGGTKCDLYSFAKGYYRLLVEPSRKLPLQMDVYNRGVDLCSRQLYDYPNSIPDAVFDPPSIPGAVVTNFAEGRKRLYEALNQRGSVDPKGDSTLELRGVVVDPSYVYVVMAGSIDLPASTVKVDGFKYPAVDVKPLVTPDGGRYTVYMLQPGKPMTGESHFEITVTPNQGADCHLVGANPIQTTWGERLIWRPNPGTGVAKTSVAKG